MSLSVPWDSRFYGIEFEFTRACTKQALIEAVHYALPDAEIRDVDWEHTRTNNPEWIIKRDGSCGWEICTPRCAGLRDFERVASVLEACRKVGAKVGPRCGIHIHLDCGDVPVRLGGNIVAQWVKSEGMIFSTIPRTRRGNSYCQTLSRSASLRSGIRYSPEQLLELAGSDRYRSLNVQPYRKGDRRIEIRILDSTFNSELLRRWLGFFLHFFRQSLEAPYPEDVKWYGLEEFMKFLGWDDSKKLDWEQQALRVWWLKRLVNFCSLKIARGGYKKEAQELLKTLDPGTSS